MRIERITIPELVQLMMAKEWITNHFIPESQSQPLVVEPLNQIPPEIQLADTLSQPTVPSPTISMVQFEANEQRIRMLELVTKLLS